jgi:hypothetical protein
MAARGLTSETFTWACNFDVADLITEVVLLANIAVRMGKKLYWDAKNMKIANDAKANRYVREPYRQGWPEL